MSRLTTRPTGPRGTGAPPQSCASPVTTQAVVTDHALTAGGGFTARWPLPPAGLVLAACNARTARSVTCGLLREADEHPRKLARLSPGVSDGDDATIRSPLVAQLEHRHARGQRP